MVSPVGVKYFVIGLASSGLSCVATVDKQCVLLVASSTVFRHVVAVVGVPNVLQASSLYPISAPTGNQRLASHTAV